jgi:hypothetical protein
VTCTTDGGSRFQYDRDEVLRACIACEAHVTNKLHSFEDKALDKTYVRRVWSWAWWSWVETPVRYDTWDDYVEGERPDELDDRLDHFFLTENVDRIRRLTAAVKASVGPTVTLGLSDFTFISNFFRR